MNYEKSKIKPESQIMVSSSANLIKDALKLKLNNNNNIVRIDNNENCIVNKLDLKILGFVVLFLFRLHIKCTLHRAKDFVWFYVTTKGG